MRYVCFQKTVSRIVDEDITSLDDIRSILCTIKDEELTCLLHLKGGEHFLQVRVYDVTETELSYSVFTAEAKLKKNSDITEIEYLEVTVSDRVLSYIKPETSRWSLLEPTEFDNEKE